MLVQDELSVLMPDAGCAEIEPVESGSPPGGMNDEVGLDAQLSLFSGRVDATGLTGFLDGRHLGSVRTSIFRSRNFSISQRWNKDFSLELKQAVTAGLGSSSRTS